MKLFDVTYSGATVGEILRSPVAGTSAQINAVHSGARLVTVTAGGNDVGYLPTLTFSSLPAPLQHSGWIRKKVETFLDAAATDERFRQLSTNLEELIAQIQARAPKAEVVIVDYLTILPRDLALVAWPPSSSIAAWGVATADRLSDTFAAVSSRSGATFLPVADRSQDHHAWAETPWTRRFHYSLRGGAPYHPNRAGMNAVAELLFDHLSAQASTS